MWDLCRNCFLPSFVIKVEGEAELEWEIIRVHEEAQSIARKCKRDLSRNGV